MSDEGERIAALIDAYRVARTAGDPPEPGSQHARREHAIAYGLILAAEIARES